MKKELFCLALLLSLLTLACKKEAAPDVYVLKFWSSCVQCLAQGNTTFTLAEKGLFDQDNQLLPDSLFQAVIQLNAARPTMLCDSMANVYGCGSCYDAEDFLLQTKCGGVERTWQFDPNDSSQPVQVQEFARLLRDVYRKCKGE